MRAILSGIGVHLIPYEASIGAAHSAFDEDGKLTDEKYEKRLQEVVNALVETVQKLHGLLFPNPKEKGPLL